VAVSYGIGRLIASRVDSQPALLLFAIVVVGARQEAKFVRALKIKRVPLSVSVRIALRLTRGRSICFRIVTS